MCKDIAPEDKIKINKEHQKVVKEWRKRKRMCMDVVCVGMGYVWACVGMCGHVWACVSMCLCVCVCVCVCLCVRVYALMFVFEELWMFCQLLTSLCRHGL